MKHFNDNLGPDHRYKNEMMEHMRKQTELLERIAQSFEGKKEGVASGQSNKGTSVNDSSQSKRGQRRNSGNSTSGNKSK